MKEAPFGGTLWLSPKTEASCIMLHVGLDLGRKRGAGPKPLVADDTSCYAQVCLEMPAYSPFRASR